MVNNKWVLDEFLVDSTTYRYEGNIRRGCSVSIDLLLSYWCIFFYHDSIFYLVQMKQYYTSVGWTWEMLHMAYVCILQIIKKDVLCICQSYYCVWYRIKLTGTNICSNLTFAWTWSWLQTLLYVCALSFSISCLRKRWHFQDKTHMSGTICLRQPTIGQELISTLKPSTQILVYSP